MAQKCMLTITLTATVHCMCVHARAYAHGVSFGTLSFRSGADVFDRVSTFLETLYRDMQKGTRGWEGAGGRMWVEGCGWEGVGGCGLEGWVSIH